MRSDRTRHARRTFVLLATGFLGVAAGCGGGGEGSGEVLAKVAGHPITAADVDARLADLPQLSRPEYSGPVGRARVLNQMIEEEVLYRAAVDDGLNRDPAVRKLLDASERQILVQSYLGRHQQELNSVPEDEIRKYYNAHKDEYIQEKLVRVRVLVAKTRAAAERVVSLEKDGQSFEQLCARFSTDPYAVEARGLLPGWLRRNKAVPWIGNHPAFHETVFSLPAGEISPIIETPKGFLVARVEEIREEKQLAFEDAKMDVQARLLRDRTTQSLPTLLDGLKEKYRVETFDPPGRSAEELFTLAQQATDPRERVAMYEEMVERYPKDERVADALFMIGFVRNEELGDREGAMAAFQKVVDQFPDSELAESARWMLSSEGASTPAFEPAPSESASAGGTAP